MRENRRREHQKERVSTLDFIAVSVAVIIPAVAFITALLWAFERSMW